MFPTSCSKQDQLLDETRLLRVGFWVQLHFDYPQGRRVLCLPGQAALLPGFFMGKKIFRMASLILSCFSLSLLSLFLTPLWRACLCFLDTLPAGLSRLLLGPLNPLFSKLSLHRQVLPPLTHCGGPLLNPCQFANDFLVLGIWKWTWHSVYDLTSAEQRRWPLSSRERSCWPRPRRSVVPVGPSFPSVRCPRRSVILVGPSREAAGHLCCQGTAGWCPAGGPPGPGAFWQSCSPGRQAGRLAPARVAAGARPPQGRALLSVTGLQVGPSLGLTRSLT